MEKTVQNIAYLGKIISIYNKQHLSNIWGSMHEKVELKKKNVAYKKIV